jgi:putative membrane-bound dehydrogenase-like protein
LLALAAILCVSVAPRGVSAAPPGNDGRVVTRLDGHAFSLPTGFAIEQIAGPPLVNRPITGDFDEQGRLYVSESSGTNDKVDKQLAERPHRILRLEDADGDGRFDRSTVFADKMMFPEGSLWHDGSLYVAAPPSIWKLTDTDDDGVADQREEWFAGKTLTGCANDLHGPYLGLDGFIYWCKGAFAEQRYERSGLRPLVTKASHIFRCRPDRSGFEHVMTGGMDNPVDVVFTAGGERVFTTTFLQNPAGGKRDGLIHAVYGGVYGKQHDVVENHLRTGDLLPPLTHLGPAAPCGLTRYRGSQFGDGWNDNLFACLFNLHKVTRHTVSYAGATLRTADEDFLVSDNIDFHPTDILSDADGSLVVINTGGWYKLCCPTSQLWKPDILGAIYRVRRIGATPPAAPPADPRGRAIAWKTLDASALAALLADSRPAVREQATQRLAKLGGPAVPALAPHAAHASPTVREAAVWALTRIDAPAARAAVRVALRDPDSTVRQAALHSVSLWRDASAAPELLAMIANSTDLANVRVAAECLGRSGVKEAVAPLLAAVRRLASDDRFLEHAITFALIEIADEAALRQALSDADPRVVRVALVALDQMEGGGLDPTHVAPLLSSSQPRIRDTASWIVNRHRDWGGALATALRSRVARTPLAEADRNELAQQIAVFARSPEVQTLVAEVAHAGTLAPDSRIVALAAMREAGLRETPASWFGAVAQAVADPEASVVKEAVATARVLPWPKQPSAELVAALTALGKSPDRPAAVRLDAFAALPAGLAAIDSPLWKFLLEQLGPEHPVTARNASATVLSRARLNTAQLVELAGLLKSVGPLEADRLLGAFEQSTDEQVGLTLVAALLEAKSLASLRQDAVKTRLSKYAGQVPAKAEAVYLVMNADLGKQRARIEQLLGQLATGDIRRGQAVFHSTKAACSSCHAMGYLGGRLGPDLTRIGGIRAERDLLEAVVYPNASFVRSYEPVVVVLESGKTYNGLVKKDNAEELVLAINATEELRFARDEIEEIRPSVVSVMPSGLDQQLSPQELADLIAFLRSAK